MPPLPARGNSTRLRDLLPRRFRSVLRAIRTSAASHGPAISHRDRVTGLAHARSIDPTARLTILDASQAPDSRIELGHNVFIGRQVELTAASGGTVRIDDDTSIQDGSILFGDIEIGAHCLFGKDCFVASRGHHFRDRPSWLIRDQDNFMLSQPVISGPANKTKVRIEEDCWIAQSVVVSPGIYIGRGAIIGANTVVTSDVAPYEIHGGVPNRKLGVRLDFSPPTAIDAHDDAAIPYFYRGFRLSQDALAHSRKSNVVEGRSKACILLARARAPRIKLAGTSFEQRHGLRLQFRINGEICADRILPPGPFEIFLEAQSAMQSASPAQTPSCLRNMTSVEITAEPPIEGGLYGIRTAELVSVA